MRIEVWKDDAAWTRLHSAEFRAQWENLYTECPWASVFQRFAYASTWYEVYRSRYTPLLIGSLDENGRLCGLFTLAIGADGSPVVAGGRQAEYQVWIARPTDGDAFIVAALDQLAIECPGRSLALRYVPEKTPLGWLRRDGVARRCVVRPIRRGIIDLREVETEAALRKKNVRNKVNRLERLGPLSFERLTDPAAIDALLEEIAPLCDLRYGAAHNVLPFREDPLKLPFHQALARLPGLLYVSVLRCGGTIASAEIDADNRGQLALGFGALTPALMRASPGRLHMLFVARDAARQGYRAIDLTPGGGYKDLLANRFDEVHTLRVALGPRLQRRWSPSGAARRVAKSVIEMSGGDIAELRKRAERWREAVDSAGPGSRPLRVLRAAKERLWADREVQLFEIDWRVWASEPVEMPLQADRVGDLVCYGAGITGFENRSVFLRRALARLERGSRPYTRVENDVLVTSAWLSVAPEAVDGVNLSTAVAADSAVVHDVAVSNRLRSPSQWDNVLRQIVRDAVALPEVKRVLVAVPSDRRELREAVVRVNGKQVGALYARTRGARTRAWSTAAPTPSFEPARDPRPAEAIG